MHLLTITLAVLVGLAKYYNPGVMERVHDYRGIVLSRDCPECIGSVAMLSHWYGKQVWLQRPGHEPEGPFLVTDTARLGSVVKNGWVVDVDWTTAKRWGMSRPISIVVYARQPWRAHNVE